MKIRLPLKHWILILLFLFPLGAGALSAAFGYHFVGGFITGLGFVGTGLFLGLWKVFTPDQR